MATLDAVLRQAIKQGPASIRRLAREAGVSHVFLAGIVEGRERATPRVARLVLAVLERWSKECAGAVARIHAALGGA